MENFELQTPTRIYFGRGRENEAGAIAKAHGARKPLICYGGGSVKRSRRVSLTCRVCPSGSETGVEKEV